MHVKRRRLTAVAIGLIAALGLAAGALAASAHTSAGDDSASPATHAAGAGQAELAAKARIALTRYLRSYRPRAQLARPGGVNLKARATSTTAVGSFNWSGYADHGAAGTFSSVSATWRQPGTVCSPEQELTAFWVGLDGFDNQTVEQDGTLSYCFEGAAYYYTWWELFPGGSVTVGSTVQPGDLITASVHRSGTNYTLSLTDVNHPANSFSTVQSCTTCENDSAEWIAERPAFSIGITPLTFFRSWNVVGATQTSNGSRGSIGSGPNTTQLTMVDATETYPLDSVSGLFGHGSGFFARWLNSY
jgi:Peptidase A4 family